jgi:hypothetical protein
MEILEPDYSEFYAKTYFFNPITGKSQWPLSTFKDEKSKLPQGWVRLKNSDGTYFYKFIDEENIDEEKVLDTKSFSYSPEEEDEDEEKKIIMSTYQSLVQSKDPRARREIHRRNDLLLSVADLLGIESSSIGDESLEYLANKFKKSLGTIMQERKVQILLISFIINEIETLEKQKLGDDKCKLTAFKNIQREDPEEYKTERSIRELLGVNMREREAGEAMDEINNLQCPMTLDGEIMKDPVICSSGITFERKQIERWLADKKGVCPVSKKPITNVLVPDQFARKIIDAFAAKYKDQKGNLWKSIRETCQSQIDFVNGNLRKLPPQIRQPPPQIRQPSPPQIRRPPMRRLEEINDRGIIRRPPIFLSGPMRRLEEINDRGMRAPPEQRREERRAREEYDRIRLALGEGSGTNAPETQNVD